MTLNIVCHCDTQQISKTTKIAPIAFIANFSEGKNMTWLKAVSLLQNKLSQNQLLTGYSHGQTQGAILIHFWLKGTIQQS